MKNKGMGRKGTESDRARNVAEQTKSGDEQKTKKLKKAVKNS